MAKKGSNSGGFGGIGGSGGLSEIPTIKEPKTPEETLMVEAWCSVLGFPADSIGIDESFFDLGGDSITSLRIVAKARSVGMRITVRQVFSHPTIEALAAVASYESTSGSRSQSASETLVKSQTLGGDHNVNNITHDSSRSGDKDEEVDSDGDNEDDDEPDIVLVADDEHAFHPFPLIGIQKAYYIGIQLSASGSESGAVQPIIFNEFDVGANLDVHRLELAWSVLIRRHDMLRGVLTDNGNIVILDVDDIEMEDSFRVEIVDLSLSNATEIQGQRHANIARQLEVYKWPLFECTAVKVPGLEGGAAQWRLQVKLRYLI